MPASLADGPWTTHGDVACRCSPPSASSRRGRPVGRHRHQLRRLRLRLRTHLAGGREPDAAPAGAVRAWRAIVDAVLAVTRAGATGADLTAAATCAAGGVPWMEHFYLGHGLGIDSAESPFIGTDLGEAYDAALVLAAGMVLVLEPLVWEDGAGGYRAEEVMLITEDGWEPMTDYPYDPFWRL